MPYQDHCFPNIVENFLVGLNLNARRDFAAVRTNSEVVLSVRGKNSAEFLKRVQGEGSVFRRSVVLRVNLWRVQKAIAQY
jgi:hypothetical protein